MKVVMTNYNKVFRLDRNRVFRPERLRSARESRGLTIRELANEIGITHQAISKYENGKSIPSAEVLMKIMERLRLPYNYFFTEGVKETEDEVVYFRSKANATAKTKRIHEVKISWLIQIFEKLEEVLEFPVPDIPDLIARHHEYFEPTDFEVIEKIALDLRKSWGLNNGPISDLTHLFEKHGIVVSIVRSEDFSIDACSKRSNGRLFILVGNERAAPSRIKFTLVHELGHYILHKDVKKTEFNKKEVYKRMEEEANYFASAFLLPAPTFSEELIVHSLDYFLLLKKRWQVSIQAMIYRARELDLINDNQSSYLWKQIAKRGWRIHEPGDDLLLDESPMLLKEAINMIIDHQVKTKRQLCEELALNQSDIEALANLPPGYLSEENSVGNIITFKKGSNGKKRDTE